MFSYEVDKNGDRVNIHVKITRGDNGSLLLKFTGEDAPVNDASLLVTVVDNDGEIMINKLIPIEDGQVTIPFTVEDTEHEPGIFTWDARIVFGRDDVETPMNPSNFEILETVGVIEYATS